MMFLRLTCILIIISTSMAVQFPPNPTSDMSAAEKWNETLEGSEENGHEIETDVDEVKENKFLDNARKAVLDPSTPIVKTNDIVQSFKYQLKELDKGNKTSQDALWSYDTDINNEAKKNKMTHAFIGRSRGDAAIPTDEDLKARLYIAKAKIEEVLNKLSPDTIKQNINACDADCRLTEAFWKLADRPNYTTNIDKRFPYSEFPYIEDYALVKIPVSLDDRIPHVDYWGEGKVVSDEGIRGFSDCYNINHEYQLVGDGPDVGRKIPNRIPVVSSNNCYHTSGYIKSNSVLIVTVAGGQGYTINSCAKDIARIVSKHGGKVVVYGVDADSKEILELTDELTNVGLSLSGNALPSELQGLTYYNNSHVYFQNTRVQFDTLYMNIATGEYDGAVRMAKSFGAASKIINEVVMTLIRSDPQKLMSFAYKLWVGGAHDIVRNQFPNPFQYIVGENNVTIVNKQYLQPLKLSKITDNAKDRQAWGVNSRDLTSETVSWRPLPVWENNKISFKLQNINYNMYLKLGGGSNNKDRMAYGSTNSHEVRHRYFLNPMFKNGTLVFSIINCEYDQGLKLADSTDSLGDRELFGHNGNLEDEGDRCLWLIAAW